MSGELILLVDDEPNIVSLAKMYLEQAGFRVTSVGDGEAALEAEMMIKPALMVLDIMLPKLDGIEVCKRLRAANRPVHILMLTAKDEDIDKILGLEMGADDYLTKPFNPRELVARIKAILRRKNGFMESLEGSIHLGDLTIDPGGREVFTAGKSIKVRNQEFDLLYTLVINRGLVLNREQLLDQAWGYDYVGQTRTVDVHIGNLRKKLAGSSVRIETVTGIGYKLVVDGW